MQSFANGVAVYFEKFCEFGKAGGYAANGKDAISPHVSRLLLACRPPAILFKITLIVVNPVDSHIRWAFANVFKKIDKIQPAFAHRNAPAPVIRPFSSVGIRASANNVQPNTISPGLVFARRMPMDDSSAATRARVSVPEIAVTHGRNATAVAKAQIASAPVVTFGSAVDNLQSSKLKANKGLFFRHGIGHSMLCLVAGVRRQPALAAILRN
jgi:hypothetical protein